VIAASRARTPHFAAESPSVHRTVAGRVIEHAQFTGSIMTLSTADGGVSSRLEEGAVEESC